jgi:hypothetical protein
MKKTLAEILAENTDEIIRQAKAINKLIEKSKEAGIEWPELEDKGKYICWHYSGTGCSSCRNTGYLYDNDEDYDVLGAEAARDER